MFVMFPEHAIDRSGRIWRNAPNTHAQITSYDVANAPLIDAGKRAFVTSPSGLTTSIASYIPSLAGTCGKIAFVATTSADWAMLRVALTAPRACGSLRERS